MFTKKTVFVIGAGASADFGLPIGTELKKQIGSALHINRVDDFTSRMTNDRIRDALMHQAKLDGNNEEFYQLMEAAKQISINLPNAKSIDAYIENHAGKRRVELCAKLAISDCILRAERASALNGGNGSPFARGGSQKGETWLGALWTHLCEGVHESELDLFFENIGFVVFNYDRCIEHFFSKRLEGYFGLSPNDSRRILAKLPIYHCYGTVGGNPFGNSPHAVEYGAEVHHTQLHGLAQRVFTYSESIEDFEMMEGIKRLLSEADQIIMLGYGFHRQNVRFLAREHSQRPLAVYATAYGATDGLYDSFRNEAHKLFSDTCIGFNLQMDRSTGHQLLSDYALRISA